MWYRKIKKYLTYISADKRKVGGGLCHVKEKCLSTILINRKEAFDGPVPVGVV